MGASRRVCSLDVEEDEEEVVAVHDSVLNTSAPAMEIGGCRYGPVAGLLRYLCLGGSRAFTVAQCSQWCGQV